LIVSAAAFATSTPARVEPVKDTMSISGCREMASPTLGPSPSTMLKTPLGTPASPNTSRSFAVITGDCSAGIITTVLPATSAAVDIPVRIASGKFQGAMTTATPRPS
jgi:hypothetical protein